jgi:hypothetical protein
MADVLHHTYLPFTADQLREHFAPVAGPGERDRHLRYYLASVEEARKYDELIRGGDKPTPAQTTRTDAMLLAANGVAVIFEAKVLSDISSHVTFDFARNQLARNIDVMLDANPTLAAPLNLREPERTFLVLLTPALTQPGRAGDAMRLRPYGRARVRRL